MFLPRFLSVPSRPPGNIKGNNLTSTSIVIQWSPISSRYAHGVLLGYKISYVTADAPNNRTWSETVVNQSATSAVIANLRKFTTYMVSVEGFTSKGSGIESKCVAVTTDEDSKIMTVYKAAYASLTRLISVCKLSSAVKMEKSRNFLCRVPFPKKDYGVLKRIGKKHPDHVRFECLDCNNN